MKLKTLISVAAVACTCGLASADTLQKVSDSGRITLGYRESSVPFSYMDASNKAIGISVDISNAIVDAVKKKLNKSNIETAWMPVTSQNRIPVLMNGTIDLECGSTTNNSARGKDVAFAINYFYTGTRLLAKKTSRIKDYGDLARKTVASTTGSTNAQVIRKYNEDKKLDMELVLGKDHTDSLLLVDSGRAVAFAMDDILLFGLIANSKEPASWEVVGESLQVEPYACMMRKDDPAFKALVDGVIGGMMKSGEFDRLYAKWFMSPIAPKGTTLGLPMSPALKDNLKALSDKPAT